MHEQPDKTLGIYLHQLTDKDAAVLIRVVNFSSSQGKPYRLETDLTQAHIAVVADTTALSDWVGGQVIRLHQTPQTPQELVLPPPLLVTRVMRVIDDAALQVNSRGLSRFTQAANEVMPAHQDTLPLPNKALTIPLEPNTLPAMAAPVVAAPVVTTLAPSTHHEIAAPQTPLALIIDDSFAIRTQLALELRDLNIPSAQAETGEQALEMLAAQSYQMIFLDIILPGIDGYEVCKQIRVRPETRKTPIIMLSGKDSPLDEVKGILAGATTYLTKPVKSERLKQTITRIARWVTEFS